MNSILATRFGEQGMNKVLRSHALAASSARVGQPWREAEPWLSQALRWVGDAVIIVALDETVRFMNPAAEVLTGCVLGDAVGRPAGEIAPLAPLDAAGAPAAASADVTLAALRRALRHGMTLALPEGQMLASRDGERIAVELTASPIDDGNGARRGAALVLRRVPPPARPPVAAHATVVASAAAEDDEGGMRFGQQIRTALHAIAGLAQLLQSPSATPAEPARDAAAPVLAAIQELLNLVEARFDLGASPTEAAMSTPRHGAGSAVATTVRTADRNGESD